MNHEKKNMSWRFSATFSHAYTFLVMAISPNVIGKYLKVSQLRISMSPNVVGKYLNVSQLRISTLHNSDTSPFIKFDLPDRQAVRQEVPDILPSLVVPQLDASIGSRDDFLAVALDTRDGGVMSCQGMQTDPKNWIPDPNGFICTCRDQVAGTRAPTQQPNEGSVACKIVTKEEKIIFVYEFAQNAKCVAYMFSHLP